MMSLLAAIQLASFRVDVTPPVGHPLCAGWYGTALGITDPLYATGVVLLGGEKPVVLCAVDWAEISNRSHLAWREKIAAAAATTPDHVAVHTLHAHCTPWPDEMAEQLLSTEPGTSHIMDAAWCDAAIDRVAAAVKESIARAQPVTHLGLGQAKVEQVASSRRIMGPNGKVKAVRWTKTGNPAVRAEPEGLVDPWVKTISFWNGEKKIAALHYYAVHNTSYDTDRMVTSDFMGLARERRIKEDDGIPHILFNGCAGNITAGKYNDGAKENRPVLIERMFQGLVASEHSVEKVPAGKIEWRVAPVFLPPRADLVETNLLAAIRDPAKPAAERSRAAIMAAWLGRAETPIPITALLLGDRVSIVGLPGESFIEYQFFAQEQRPGGFVAVASYGDCGPGYICMAKSYEEGGYEPTDSFVSPKCEEVMKEALTRVLAK